MNKYTTKTTEINRSGWNYLNIEIFRDEEKIGEYTRNYSTMFRTFYPFELDGIEYALYSPKYTETRVMTLPDCKDIAVVDDSFCPTDYYIPEICIQKGVPDAEDPEPVIAHHSDGWRHRVEKDDHIRFYYPRDKEHPHYGDEEYYKRYKAAQEESLKLHDEWYSRHPFIEITAPFGFVAGCYWGDDSSYKIQFLDLSRLKEGIITQDDRFGYIEMPQECRDLSQIISTEFYDAKHPVVEIGVAKRFEISGKLLNPDGK